MTMRGAVVLLGGASILLLLASASHAQVCSQAVKDNIFETNNALRELKTKYVRCTGNENNEARSACWKAFVMSSDDERLYEELDTKYHGFITLCPWDSILYNLGNYRQAFGRNCRAFDSFAEIKIKGRYAQLSQIMADASLQCARDSRVISSDPLKLKAAHEYLRSVVANAPRATQIQRQRLGRLLGTWRDVFAIPAETSDATSVAQAIHSFGFVWPNWESFLSRLRIHLPSWASSLYPNQGDKSVTAAQYELSAQKLSL